MTVNAVNNKQITVNRDKNKTGLKKIIFAGSGYFAVPQIETLSKFCDLEVITQKNETPVKKNSRELSLKIYEVNSGLELENLLRKLKPFLLIVSDFGIILSLKALQIPKLVINTHPSLLPKHRGPSPYISAILSDEKETGISIIEMTKKVDAGPIFIKEKVKIEKEENQVSLRKKLEALASKMLISNLGKITKGKIKPKTQDESKATYTKIFTKKDGEINWSEDAETIERKIRAFEPWPGNFTFFELQNSKRIRVKIKEAEIKKGNVLKPGKIKIEGNELKIKTGKNYLIVKKIQPEGKKIMSSAEFLRGYQLKNGI